MAELLTLARPYAKAAFEYAQAGDSLDLWSEALRLLATAAVDPAVCSLRDNPKLTEDDLVALYSEPFSSHLNEQHVNFVRLLARNRRLLLLPEIHFLFEQHKAEALKRVDVELVSAIRLDDKTQDLFAQALRKRLGREIKLTCKEDESLVGGAIIRAGDQVIDGSVKGRLQQMAESLAS